MNTKSGLKVSGNQGSIIELLYCRGKTPLHDDDSGKRTVRNVQHVDFTDVHCAEFEGLSEDCSLVISLGCQHGLPAKKTLTPANLEFSQALLNTSIALGQVGQKIKCKHLFQKQRDKTQSSFFATHIAAADQSALKLKLDLNLNVNN